MPVFVLVSFSVTPLIHRQMEFGFSEGGVFSVFKFMKLYEGFKKCVIFPKRSHDQHDL